MFRARSRARLQKLQSASGVRASVSATRLPWVASEIASRQYHDWRVQADLPINDSGRPGLFQTALGGVITDDISCAGVLRSEEECARIAQFSRVDRWPTTSF